MRIIAQGPKIAIIVNDEAVNSVDLSEFKEPGIRPDGSKHKFEKLRVARFSRANAFSSTQRIDSSSSTIQIGFILFCIPLRCP